MHRGWCLCLWPYVQVAVAARNALVLLAHAFLALACGAGIAGAPRCTHASAWNQYAVPRLSAHCLHFYAHQVCSCVPSQNGACVRVSAARSLLLQEMVTRCLKNQLREIMRAHTTSPYEDMRQKVVQFFNLVWGNSDASRTYWSAELQVRSFGQFNDSLP